LARQTPAFNETTQKKSVKSDQKNVKSGKDSPTSFIGNWEIKSWEEFLALLLISFARAKRPQVPSSKANGTIDP